MNTFGGMLVVAAALGVVSAASAQSYQNIEQPSIPPDESGAPALSAVARLNAVQAALNVWSPVPASAARGLIDKYGPPDEVHASFLVWNHAGPWAQTVVFDSDVAPGGRDLGLIEQTVDYALRPEQIGALAAFDRRLSYNARVGQLSALSETEELNFLRLNLADDVISGRKTPQQARAVFERTVSLSVSGKSSDAMRGFHFPFGLPKY